MDDGKLKKLLQPAPHGPAFEAILGRSLAKRRLRRTSVAVVLLVAGLGLVATFGRAPAPEYAHRQAPEFSAGADISAYAASTEWLLQLPDLPEQASRQARDERAAP